MGQSVSDRIANVSTMPFSGSTALRVLGAPNECEAIDAQLITSPPSRDRLLESVYRGLEDFVLASADGRVSVRVRLAIPASTRARQVVGNGALVLDWSSAAVEHDGNRVSLTQTELRLLSALVEADGRVVSRSALIASAWPRSDTEARENSLAVYICGLRKRLASVGLPDALQTVRREGYRLRL